MPGRIIKKYRNALLIRRRYFLKKEIKEDREAHSKRLLKEKDDGDNTPHLEAIHGGV